MFQLEQAVKVQIQLRRPSDGAVSESRHFEFLPLDSGRSYWTTKRLKTNYNIFNSILSVDQSMRNNNNEELKRKIRLPSSATAASLQSPPQMAIAQPLSDSNAQQSTAAPMTTSYPPPPPPARNFHNLSMVPHSQLTPPTSGDDASLSLLALPGQHQQQMRPLSQSSDLSTATNATDATKQSVNDILSMAAEHEEMSVYSMDLNQALEEGNDGGMSFSALMKLEPTSNQPAAAATSLLSSAPVSNFVLPPSSTTTSQHDLAQALKNPAVEIMGSMTSVATVRENKPVASAPTTAMKTEAAVADSNTAAAQAVPAALVGATMDIDDVGALYDDVMQVVYDDVDTKYDGMTFGDDEDPPLPPQRKRNMSVDLQVDPDKPLPGTPSKLPTIITKITGGKKDPEAAQKKKEEEERKKREKKEAKERETKRKQEEAEKKKQDKKKAEEEKKARQEAADKTSLFQRLFTRSKSQVEFGEESQNEANDLAAAVADASNGNAVVDSNAPPVPPHQNQSTNASPSKQPASANETSIDSLNGNANNNPGEPTEADLNDLQDFLDSGNLDHLDNMVNEFAKQYMPESGSAVQSPAGPQNNNGAEAANKAVK